jgi:predicted ATPase
VQILALLERRLPLLTGGARDLPERQRTLRATIEWSYELLTSAEQSLFARMAVFVGGCTLDAAQEVAEADIDTLLSLVDKSLLRHADDRYLMLETIREFAHEQLMRLGEAEALAARHADCFIAVAERAKSSFGTSGEAASIELLVRDQDNFRAALAYVADSPLQLRLACALWRFWLQRGHHSEGRRWLEAALLARDDAPPADVALGLRASAVFARVHGDLDVAEASRALRLLAEPENVKSRWTLSERLRTSPSCAATTREQPSSWRRSKRSAERSATKPLLR